MSLCVFCGGSIPEIKLRRGARYCSKKCRGSAHALNAGRIGSGLAAGTVGAIGELIVAADLLRRGFEVFRALSPNCSCDLAILRDGRLLKVEVTTSYRNPRTGVIHRRKKTSERFDILAMVVGAEIIYEPAIDS